MKADYGKSLRLAQFVARGSCCEAVVASHAVDSRENRFVETRGDNGVAAESDLKMVEGEGQCEAMPSSWGGGEGRAPITARPLQPPSRECRDILHELSDVITGLRIDVQVLNWRLPPYSRLKRPVRDVERHAQLGGELLKRLMERLAGAEVEMVNARERDSEEIISTNVAAEEVSEVNLTRIDCVTGDLTSDCDPCTSGIFPKRDDGN
jgi:hypothetical protein